MNTACSRYLPFIISAIFLFSCKNHKPTVAANDNPIFHTDPNLKIITQQIERSPNDAALYFQRGELLHKMQLDTLALKDYKAAATLDSSKAEYFSAVGDVLFENKDLDASVAWLKKAIEKDPTDKKAHLKIAKLFLYIKKYPEAFEEINKVLRADVYNPEAYFLKGMVYKNLKDTAKAISSFQTAIQVSPDYRDALVQLGLLYFDKKDSVGLKYMDNAYAIDSSDVFPIYAKGVFYQSMKNDNLAKEEFHRCVLKDWHYVDAYFNMGYILLQEDSVQKAYRQYNIVTQIDPTNPTGYYNRGLCSELMDSLKKAVADYKQAVALDPSYKSPKEALKRLRVN